MSIKLSPQTSGRTRIQPTIFLPQRVKVAMEFDSISRCNCIVVLYYLAIDDKSPRLIIFFPYLPLFY